MPFRKPGSVRHVSSGQVPVRLLSLQVSGLHLIVLQASEIRDPSWQGKGTQSRGAADKEPSHSPETVLVGSRVEGTRTLRAGEAGAGSRERCSPS